MEIGLRAAGSVISIYFSDATFLYLKINGLPDSRWDEVCRKELPDPVQAADQ